MDVLPPGTILQRLYLKERIKKTFNRGDLRFCEIGGGIGMNSNLLNNLGFKGVCYDLSPESCRKNSEINKMFIKNGTYRILNRDFLSDSIDDKFDIIFSSMVIEHLDSTEVEKYFEKCKSLLNKNGMLIVLVPAGMQFWGIEDEISGHYKRYDYDCFREIATKHNLRLSHIAGLTYPISNFLLPLSNSLIVKAESEKKKMTLKEQTILSGHRNVKFKTTFPQFVGFFVNEITLYPVHLIQKIFRKSKRAMVIYCELKLKQA